MADKLKLLVAFLLLCGAIWGFYFFGDQALFVRVIGLLVAMVVITAVVMQTAVGRNAWGFIQESRVELRKVVWPTRKETTQTTLIVMAMVVAIGLFLWALDALFIQAVKLLTGQGA